MFAAGANDGSMSCFDAHASRVLRKLEGSQVGDGLIALAWSGDGKRLAGGGLESVQVS